MDGQDPPQDKGDPFLLNYNSADLRIASEFLLNWLPFLSKDLCQLCCQTLSDRVRSIIPDPESDEATEPLNKECIFAASTSNNDDFNYNDNTNSLGSWKGSEEEEKVEMNDLSSFQAKEPTSTNEDWRSFEAREPPLKKEPTSNNKDWSSFEASEQPPLKKEPTSNNKDRRSFEASKQPPLKKEPISNNEDSNYLSEDDFEVDDDEEEVHREVVKRQSRSGEATMTVRVLQNAHLSKEEKKHNRFSNVKREMDYICLERVEGRIVNIISGLELHTGVFSAAEQTKIVDFVYQLQEMGKISKAGPLHRQRQKRRLTLHFGCVYNYGFDKRGNPPGILRDVIVDPLPKIFKTMIKRLVRWHVVPPTCIPDSCTVHVYEEGDSIPPHIDNYDFLRPFCTVSLLSECSMVFGSNLTFLGAGDYSGSHEISLPVGSVVVLNGNSADVSKHFMPAVPAKRISITFRKMDESKWPTAYNPEPDLQGIQPLGYANNKTRWQKNPRPVDKQQAARRVGGGNREGSYARENLGGGNREGSYARENLGGGNREGSYARENLGGGNREGSYARENVGGGNREGSYARENVGRPGSLQIHRGPDNTRRVRVNPDRYD
ncbi:RNA demethylase ALKBH9B-like [Impatiens glandulifera]|uniref:RNA demethylase ALKBH9B-like n=1 Tax=Impatiens glandulifera TaxID=253017 RepID=UPI001FB16412|nr:RNA demethylase ALKBH9B-like [Impatiens glandulifera]